MAYLKMKSRCYNPQLTAYRHYGGRGIIVCDRWLESFQNFYEDMGDRPEGKTLDRIDNDKGYSPDNCRWATRSEQGLNKRPYGKSSKLRGVYWHKSEKIFRAKVRVNGSDKHIGRFNSEYEAGLAYDMFVIKNSLPNQLNGDVLYGYKQNLQ